MKKSVSIFLIISIIVVGAFSLLALGSHSHDGSLCPVATINGNSGDCTPFNDAHDDLAMVFYHLLGINNLFNVGAGQMTLISFLLAFFCIIFLTARFVVPVSVSFLRSMLRRIFMAYVEFISWSTQSFLKWIARLNKCDCLSI